MHCFPVHRNFLLYTALCCWAIQWNFLFQLLYFSIPKLKTKLVLLCIFYLVAEIYCFLAEAFLFKNDFLGLLGRGVGRKNKTSFVFFHARVNKYHLELKHGDLEKVDDFSLSGFYHLFFLKFKGKVNLFLLTMCASPNGGSFFSSTSDFVSIKPK